MEIVFGEKDGVCDCALSGELDMYEAPGFLERCEGKFQTGWKGVLLINLSALAYADSSGRFSVVCSALMAEGVGGDYYFVREYEPGLWFLCLCDISGKGTAAAIITAVLAGFMDSALFASPLAETVLRLNELIRDTFRAERYLTGVFIKVDEATGEGEYCDMGHSLAYVARDGRVTALSEVAANPPLGMVSLDRIAANALVLGADDTLLVVSDGITEQENRRGESFSLETVAENLRAHPSGEAGLVRAKVAILEAFYAFKRDMPQRDDVSVLLARRVPPGG